MIKRISEEECNKLYEKYKTPPHVIAHCRAVCNIAVTLGEKLNEHGSDLDIELIRGAALSHDMARVCKGHATAGAAILSSLGYYDEAAIVRDHMKHRFGDFDRPNETDIVCLADRLVKEDKYVGLDVRMDYIIHKAKGRPEVTEHILRSKAKTRDFMDRIEEKVGQTIDSLFSGKGIE